VPGAGARAKGGAVGGALSGPELLGRLPINKDSCGGPGGGLRDAGPALAPRLRLRLWRDDSLPPRCVRMWRLSTSGRRKVRPHVGHESWRQ
jgi:hypothetical protein